MNLELALRVADTIRRETSNKDLNLEVTPESPEAFIITLSWDEKSALINGKCTLGLLDDIISDFTKET